MTKVFLAALPTLILSFGVAFAKTDVTCTQTQTFEDGSSYTTKTSVREIGFSASASYQKTFVVSVMGYPAYASSSPQLILNSSTLIQNSNTGELRGKAILGDSFLRSSHTVTDVAVIPDIEFRNIEIRYQADEKTKILTYEDCTSE